jgi:hypothetical protein
LPDSSNPNLGGLFWTVEIPAKNVHVNLRKGHASMEVLDLPILDFGTLANSFAGPFGGDIVTSGRVSFSITWSGVKRRLNIRNDRPEQSGGGFAGEFIQNDAQIEWTATLDNGITLVSAPLETSFSRFAEIGHERNGSFFP